MDKAAEMIEQLLVPTDEARNEHKRLQLRELAALNGTLKDDQHCYICGQTGHRQFECPTKQDEVYQLPTAIQAKVEAQYQRDIARVHGEPIGHGRLPLVALFQACCGTSGLLLGALFVLPASASHVGTSWLGSYYGAMWGTAGRLDDEYKNFMAELGGGPPPSGPGGSHGRASGFSSGPAGGGGGSGGGRGGHLGGPGLGFDDGRGFRGGGPRSRPGDDLPDECKLYVGNLSPIITDEVLRGMMEPFGTVLHAVVLLDMPSGTSRGFGFVHMDKAESAGMFLAGRCVLVKQNQGMYRRFSEFHPRFSSAALPRKQNCLHSCTSHACYFPPSPQHLSLFSVILRSLFARSTPCLLRRFDGP